MARQWQLKGHMMHTVEVIGPVTKRKQPISVASHRAKILCADCQRYFKGYEDRTKEILVRMERGDELVFSPDELHALATWGAKTAYMLIAAEKGMEDVVPEAQRHGLRSNDVPPSNLWVGYGQYNGHGHKGVHEHTIAGYKPRYAYGAVLFVARIALKVFGFSDNGPPMRPFGCPPILRQTWPTRTRPVDWPPDEVIRADEYGRLARMVPFVGYLAP
ncbi:MAG: hypothetical protein QOE36_3784 [Gaiellaceae bacterium]|jgi:hypothetical protein|nr:hypothetical protein [Gaiellaceae bacterium]